MLSVILFKMHELLLCFYCVMELLVVIGTDPTDQSKAIGSFEISAAVGGYGGN